MSTRFFTNDNSNTLLKKFEGTRHSPPPRKKLISSAPRLPFAKRPSADSSADLVKMEKTQKKTPLKPAALLDKILEIIGRYDFSSYDGEPAEDLNAGLSASDLEPVIILSESFCTPV